MLYGFHDKPKKKAEWAFLSFQQAAVVYIGMLPVPLMFGSVLGMTALETGKVICACAIGAGLASLIQLFLGSKLPILQGPSFAFGLVGLTIFSMIDGSIGEKMSLYCTVLLAGGALTMLIGYSGLIGMVKKALTPVVTGTVIALIGISLASWAANTAGVNWLLAAIMVAVVFFLSFYCSPRVGAFSALVAILLGYIVCLVGTWTGVFGAESGLFVDFTYVKTAAWFAFPMPFTWGAPKWSTGAFLVILAPYFAAIVESVGDYLAASQGAQMPVPTKKQYNRGIGAEGLGCIVSALFGGSGVTSYSQNTSLMILTKVASRAVYAVAAVMIIILGFVPKIGTVFGTLPDPVIGGVYFATFGLILAIGIKIIGTGVNLNKDRNLTVAGLSIFLGIALPYYIGQYPIVIASATWLADILNAILGTQMVVGGIFAILFDRILPDRDPAAEEQIADEPVEQETPAV